MSDETLLAVEGLGKTYRVKGVIVKALKHVDLTVESAETLAVVGESGSGKTTLGRLILGLEPSTVGRMLYRGVEIDVRRSLMMRRRIQLVDQNPLSALNPSKTVEQSIALPLQVHQVGTKRTRRTRVAELLDEVELTPNFMTRRPSELSGGQRQRVALARALAAEPELLVLDEPTSALDVSVQAKIMALLVSLQRRLRLTYLFITHDLAVARNLAKRIVVLYRGKIVEIGPVPSVFARPRHRYTAMLLASVPVVTETDAVLKPTWPWERMLQESETRQSPGCGFAARCPFVQDLCLKEDPELIPSPGTHQFACHFPAEG